MDTADMIELVGIILAFVATNIGHLVSARSNYDKMVQALKEQSEKADAAFDKAMSVYSSTTDLKIEELTREVREHNNFARRVPLMEEQIKQLDRRVSEIGK